MEKTKIGYSAGIIWQVIDENKALKISDLKRITKMDLKDLFLALGWLARENKITFFEEDKKMTISLVN